MAYNKLSDLKNRDQSTFRSYEIDVPTGTTTDWIIIDDEAIKQGIDFTVMIRVSTGTGSVQYTTEPYKSIIEDTATASDWPDGTVSVDTGRCMPSGITAIKFVNATGAVKGTISV